MPRRYISHNEWEDQFPERNLHGDRRGFDAPAVGSQYHRIHGKLGAGTGPQKSPPPGVIPEWVSMRQRQSGQEHLHFQSCRFCRAGAMMHAVLHLALDVVQ